LLLSRLAGPVVEAQKDPISPDGKTWGLVKLGVKKLQDVLLNHLFQFEFKKFKK
jgi:hypothetical protein